MLEWERSGIVTVTAWSLRATVSWAYRAKMASKLARGLWRGEEAEDNEVVADQARRSGRCRRAIS
nr:hypothetical protein Iba_chr12fCG11190 [Ipomoea batatas]